MRVNDSLLLATYQCLDSTVRHISGQLILMITEIWQGFWERVSRAYHEPSKQLPKLEIPPHPIPNSYSKHFKRKSWPRELNNAWGASFANRHDVENIAKFIEPNEKVTPLHAVTLGNNSQGLFRLIADDGDVNAKDIRGQSPAYWAAYHGNLQALTVLKIYGADLFEKDSRGKTPLRAAVKYGHEPVIEFLASHGANLNETDGRGLTPLHLAAYLGRFQTYQKLTLLGADRSLKDPHGHTAEEILKMKFAQTYHNRWFFITRLFSSPIPPPLCFGNWKIENLASRAAINQERV